MDMGLDIVDEFYVKDDINSAPKNGEIRDRV